MNAELAIILPTLNEVANIEPLIERLEHALAGCRWEAVFVDDDSTDGTIEVLRSVSSERPNIRFIQRIGRRGLASACIEGILATNTPLVAIMDADLQHDEAILPRMLEILKTDNVDIVIGSRFAPGGSAGGLSSKRRHRLSRFGNRLSQLVTKTRLSDPMTGFFMVRRTLFDEVAHRLTGRGYKILLDILVSSKRPVSIREIPFHFRTRQAGESKLDMLVTLEFLFLIADKLFRGWLPVRFILFVMVGLTGVGVHLILLGILFRGLDTAFALAQGMATVAAMTSNFILNNHLTFRDRRLQGLDFLKGLGSFYLACGIGALISLIVATYVFSLGVWWFLAGFLGAVIGAVWNYSLTATFTWRQR